MDPSDVETLTITSAGHSDQCLEETALHTTDIADDKQDVSWPVPTATRLDIHQGPPKQPTTHPKPTDDSSMADEQPDISRGKVKVLKHDLEKGQGRRGNDVSGSLTVYEECVEDAGRISSHLTPKTQMLIMNLPQFAADSEDQAIASSLRRARSFVKGNRPGGRDIDHAHMETGQNSAHGRQVEKRRSYNTQRASYDTRGSTKRGDNFNRLPYNTEGTSGESGKFIAGLYSAGTTDIGGANQTVTTEVQSVNPAPPQSLTRRRAPVRAKQRPHSPNLTANERSYPVIPVPTALGPPNPSTGLHQEGVAMNEVTIPDGRDYTESQDGPPPKPRARDKAGWKSAKRSPVDGGMDHGVSNTTQMLLETKMRTQILSFPTISAEEQRRALGSPRHESSLLSRRRPTSSRSPSKSPTRQLKRSSSKEGNDRAGDNREKLPDLEGNPSHLCINLAVDTTTANENVIDNTDVSKSEQISLLTPRANAKEMSGSIVSLNSESSKKTATTMTNNRDRYSRMIALGLPRVNLDIEKDHFSRHSLKRRSQKLREKFEIPNEECVPLAGPQLMVGVSKSEPPAVQDHVEMPDLGAPSQPPPSLCKSVVVGPEDDTDAMWPGQEGDMDSVILKTYEAQQINQVYLNGSSLENAEPPLTSAPKELRASDLRARGNFQRQNNIRLGKNKSVNYTYFRMMPPGQMKCSPASSVIESPRASKAHLYQGAA